MNDENKKTILLVEDEAIIALTEKSILEKYGYSVITANTGEKAIELFAKDIPIDLILMDIDLGAGIDGPETASIILKDSDIPVVFLSSHTEPAVVQKTEKITSYGYVVKSSSITVLDASIKMAFKLFEANQKIVESEVTVRKKLDAVLEPEGDITELNLTDIIDQEAIRVLMEGFYNTTHISGAVLDINGKVLVAFGWQDICTTFHRIHPHTSKNCYESDVELSTGVQAGSFKAYKCKNDLWDMVTPIVIGGRHMGNIYLGQFFYEDDIIDYEIFRNRALRYGFNEKEYIAALDRVPRLSRKSIDATMQFCSKLAGLISNLSYSTIKLSRALAQNEISFHQLGENDKKQAAMIANISDVIGIIGVDGIMKYKSPNIEKWFGWKPEDLIGTDGWQTIHPDDLERIQKVFYTLLEKDNSSQRVEYRYKCKDGSYKPIALTATNLVNDPNINGVLLNYHDISTRTQAEDTLRESEEKFRLLYTSMDQGMALHQIITDDDGKPVDYIFLDINDSYTRLLGVTREMSIGRRIKEVMPKVEQYWIDIFGKVALTGESSYYENYLETTGKYYSTYSYCPKKNLFAVLVTDITGRKQAEEIIKTKSEELEALNQELKASNEEMEAAIEEQIAANEEMEAANEELLATSEDLIQSENRYRSLLQNLEAGIVVHAPDTSILINNSKASELLGLSDDQMKGKTAIDPEWKFINEDNTPLSLEEYPVNRISNSRKQIQNQVLGISQPCRNEIVWVTVNGFPVLDSRGGIIEIVISFIDITERKLAGEKVKSILAGKEILLKEVHHRIKNNMATLKGLLFLQADGLTDSSAVSALQVAESRVGSMMVLYEKLYRSSDFKELSLKEYLPLLVDEIIGNFPDKKRVKIENHIEEFMLNADTLFNIGILLNELLTNIMKHAFNGMKNGVITISASIKDNHVSIVIADTGVGIPESVKFENSTGFGMQLVSMLTEQIGGNIRIERGEGTRFVLEFDV